ncbi:unnamed protein product [Cladocopium goreaui]|uniref:von Willebrand factor A domain-containing protein 8 n=1 Tax=Cladocopium goreaui TaxID=2562237 RepID=A0A9P1GKF3_9DINO|nr:unnamed protein product [Cladocopium goreaui]
MAQKMELGQDMLLLGPPGSLRRQLALRFCELQGREAEVLTVTRDTTESDLKQRRELSRSGLGSRTIYADSAPVRCALRGRVLVLDGLEKAERNVLPTLNNLLENREMQLDDGRLLIPARRYDVLSQQEISAEEGKAKLVRVHEDFRVVALAVPCPPWPGNPLDPPLRSRFQARIIMPPTLLSTTQLAPFFRACACKENTCKLFINQSSGNGLRKVCLKHFQPLPDDWWINITTLLYQCFQQISTIYLVYAKQFQPII